MARDAVDRNEQRDRLLQLLRKHGTTFVELGRNLGSRMGLHPTDSTALVEILEAQDRGTPLTASELSRRVGLTGGATSSLLNRLEGAGHIQRARGSTDRRIVILHATDGVEAEIDRYFDPLTERMGAMMQEYPPEMLQEFERFLTGVCETMISYSKTLSPP